MAESYGKWRREAERELGAVRFWINQLGDKTIYAQAFTSNGEKVGHWDGCSGWLAMPKKQRAGERP